MIEDFSARTPNSNSQYIYQDLNIFLFICITKKLSLSQEWLKKYISERASTEAESKEITNTFKNLLNDNLQSNDNKPEIIIVYKSIVGFALGDEKILTDVYQDLSVRQFPYFSSDFLNVLALKTIDLIIIAKGLKNIKETEIFESFLTTFEKRIYLISVVIFTIILILLLSISVYVTIKLFFGNKEESEIADKILTAFGAASIISIFSILWKGKSVIEKIQGALKSFFGFSENTSRSD